MEDETKSNFISCQCDDYVMYRSRSRLDQPNGKRSIEMEHKYYCEYKALPDQGLIEESTIDTDNQIAYLDSGINKNDKEAIDNKEEDTADKAVNYTDIDDRDVVIIETTEAGATYRRKMFYTILHLWNYSTMAMAYGQFGPVLPDMQLITRSSLQDVAWLYTGFGIGYTIGCLLNGIVQEKLDGRLLLFLSTVGTGLTAGLLPWIPWLYVSVVVRIIQGYCIGGQDIVSNTMIFAIWRSECGPYMQMLYVVYSAGGIVSPLYSKPFLQKSVEENTTSDWLTIYDTGSFKGTNATYSDNAVLTGTNVHYAFFITAFFCATAAVPFLLLYICNLSNPTHWSNTDHDRYLQGNKPRRFPARIKYILLSIMFILSFLTTACIDMFPQFLTIFVMEQLSWTQQDGSTITSIFYLLYCVGNVLGFVILKIATTNILILISYIGTIVSFTSLLIFSLLQNTTLIWVSVSSIGLSTAAIMPTLYTWTEQNVTPVTSRVASGMLVMGSVAVISNALILGYLIESYSAMWLVYTCLGGLAICAVLFSVAFVSVKIYHERKEND